MDRFSAPHLGRLDSLRGVGQSNGIKGSSLASFLSQRANQVLGARQSAQAVQSPEAESQSAPEVPQDSSPINPQLARQMQQLQRLHSSISLPANQQGISVLV